MSYNHNTIASHMEVIEPCRFPRFDRGEEGPNRLLSVRVELDQRLELRNNFGQDELPSVLRTAWALVLGCYTGLEDVCFGFKDLHSPPTKHVSTIDDNSSSVMTACLHLLGTSSLEELVLAEGRNKMHPVRLPRTQTSGCDASEQEPPFNTLVLFESQPEISPQGKTMVHDQLSSAVNLRQVSLIIFNGISKSSNISFFCRTFVFKFNSTLCSLPKDHSFLLIGGARKCPLHRLNT